MGALSIRLKILTPLWTGGVDQTCDRLHETGLIGSLRWWYEALVRGLGGTACDPSQGSCQFDEEKYRRSKAVDERQRLREAGLCDACQIFGATGWKRRFRLEVMEDQTELVWKPPPDLLNIRPPDRQRGWFLPPGRMGEFTLQLTGDESILSLLAALILFLEQWGNLGAKPQLGYGVFRITNRKEVQEKAQQWIWKGMGKQEPDRSFPDLRRFGFFRYRFQPPSRNWWVRVPGMERVATQVSSLVREHRVVPVAPTLKNEWRFHRWTGKLSETVYLFGSSSWRENEEIIRIRSKIAVSWAYPEGEEWEVRGFAWLPEDRVAQRAWEVLRNPEGWENVLPKGGVLKTDPETAWNIRSIDQVIGLLNAAKGACQ